MKLIKLFYAAILIISVLILIETNCQAQKNTFEINDSGCPVYGSDKQKALEQISLFNEMYKKKNYEKALPYWRYVFENAPGLREGTFIRGEKMHQILIEKEPNKKKRKQLKKMLNKIRKKHKECW